MAAQALVLGALALATAACIAAEPALCRPGKAVSVLYAGKWYPAKVLEGPDSLGTCLVSYDGFGANWDERVSAARLRPVGAVPLAGGAASQGAERSAAIADLPAGKYACYTFDNGQLNYAYTDLVIGSDNRYSVGEKKGRYTLSGGVMTFTGTMANVSGRASMASSGRPKIDLIFNGDARASMTCAKSG